MKKIMWKNIYVTFHIKAHKIGQLRAEYERTTSTYKKKKLNQCYHIFNLAAKELM